VSYVTCLTVANFNVALVLSILKQVTTAVYVFCIKGWQFCLVVTNLNCNL